MQQNKQMEVPQQWVKASFPLNVREIVHALSYKSMTLFVQRGFEHTSGASENFLSSRTV